MLLAPTRCIPLRRPRPEKRERERVYLPVACHKHHQKKLNFVGYEAVFWKMSGTEVGTYNIKWQQMRVFKDIEAVTRRKKSGPVSPFLRFFSPRTYYSISPRIWEYPGKLPRQSRRRNFRFSETRFPHPTSGFPRPKIKYLSSSSSYLSDWHKGQTMSVNSGYQWVIFRRKWTSFTYYALVNPSTI